MKEVMRRTEGTVQWVAEEEEKEGEGEEEEVRDPVVLQLPPLPAGRGEVQ